MAPPNYSGFDLLTTAVLLLDEQFSVKYANAAAENLFAVSKKNMEHMSIEQLLGRNETFVATLHQALTTRACFYEHEVNLALPGRALLTLSCTISPLETGEAALLLEFMQMNQQLKIAREERILQQQELNRQLIRNLAHEIRNPLGGIRGAAQLLERELDRPDLREYTEVIVKETGRLQALLDRLLTPHRPPQITKLNIHEVLERVRRLILAENQQTLIIRRDYDTSLPLLTGDKEQLIQATLNIVRNAAQAMDGKGEIILRTRIARQVTLAKRRHRHAISVDIIDNGPGIPESLRENIFYPLVSGREGGTGLGLSIAQNHINQYHGIIEFVSEPGYTCFTLLLPVSGEDQ